MAKVSSKSITKQQHLKAKSNHKTSPKKLAQVKTTNTHKIPKLEKPMNKLQVVDFIANQTELSKKEVAGVLTALFDIATAHLRKRGGVGEFTIPNLAKIRVINKPATKARKGVNPFTQEPMTVAAKPARNVVKIKPLKRIKEAVK